MFKFIQSKSFQVITVANKTYSTLASNNYNSFIIINGVKLYQTTFDTLRENGYKDFGVRKKYLKKNRIRKYKKVQVEYELRRAA